MTIPFIDLKTQYARLKTDIDERIRTVLDHGAYIMGPEIEELERQLADFCGARYAISCSSGTDALLLALMADDIGPGDAVFTSSFTFFATAEVISLCGATPVFVDIDSRTFNLDADELETTIERVTKAGNLVPRCVMPVNLFGLPPDMDRITEIARAHKMMVLEDTAQGFGGVYKGRVSGSLGDISATSFFPAKPLGCYGDGGAVFTDDQQVAEKIRSIRVHGQGADKYDNVRIGLNARMDSIQAAILIAKLQVFSEEIELRQEAASRYSKALAGLVETPYTPEGYTSVWAQYSILSDHRDAIQKALADNGIPSVIYYRIPCHLAGAYKELGYQEGDLPKSETAAKRILSLPMHPYLEPALAEQIAHIVARTVA
ncbi:MAG: DegT/DnrJ/EryC1/StrS aminotransferase family protein [Gammaproteobacteria bacterium]|nr:DegT/DnrJ/EryC1/StrS aminotransferase family protein [Gammaproteobacteria bacterium]